MNEILTKKAWKEIKFFITNYSREYLKDEHGIYYFIGNDEKYYIEL